VIFSDRHPEKASPPFFREGVEDVRGQSSPVPRKGRQFFRYPLAPLALVLLGLPSARRPRAAPRLPSSAPPAGGTLTQHRHRKPGKHCNFRE